MEDGPSAASSVPQSARNADFDSNFDDDFGFDNQTFSHTNAQQPAAQPSAPASSGFDDNFDSAFDIPAASPPAASTQAPALPARPAAVGFDDDFFSSPVEPQQPAAQQQPQPPQGFTYSTTSAPAQRQSYDMPPSGEPPSTAARQSESPAPATYAPPAGPPPQQTSAPAQAPSLPARSDTDGDLPQVKELVGMGFNRRQAIAALEDNQFDLERAANALLSVNN